jgi:thiamine biosynthesis lipoprotein
MSATSRSTRREFLQGKAVLAIASEVAGDVAGPGELPQRDAKNYLLRLSRRAMACEFEVFFNAGQYERGTETALKALDLVDCLEDQLSVFRHDSEICRLNSRAANEPVAVEPRLFALLAQAVRVHADTRGAYDITAGPLSGAWGFMRRNGSVPTPAAIAAARDCVGSQYLELDGTASSVRFLKPGVEINLGSIGKGYALDRCAELLAAAGINDFLLHGGNSSVLGRGAQGSVALDQGWSVGVRNPLRPNRRIGELRLKDRALATSGSGTQFFIHDARRYGHILDPRSGWPAEGVLSVSTLAPTAAEADALSTAFYVMGPEQAKAYCREHPEIAAVMLCPGKRAGSIEKHLLGLDPSDWAEIDEPLPPNPVV